MSNYNQMAIFTLRLIIFERFLRNINDSFIRDLI